MKKEVHGRHYGTILTLQAAVDQILKDIPAAEFQQAMDHNPDMLVAALQPKEIILDIKLVPMVT